MNPAPQPPTQYEWDFAKLMKFAQLGKIALRDLTGTDQSLTFAKYSKSQLVEYLKTPDKNAKQLREMSVYLYNISNYYRRLILYFARMPTFAYTVVPYNLDLSKTVNTKTFRTQYQKVLNDLDKMNIRHEFQKILTVAFKQDVFYGYVYETNDSFMVKELDPTYCKISSIEDGVFNFAFDNSYWDSRKAELELAANEFKTNYNAYKSQGSKAKWIELNAANTICIKVNEEVVYPIPPFVSLFSALADIEDYRALSKASTEVNNYKALSLRIPLRNDDGKPLIDWDKALEYYNQLLGVLPENIGAILTPMEIDNHDFGKTGAFSDTNMVAKAEASFFAESGVNSQLLGGGDKSSSSAMELSREVDETMVFGLLRQFERWINRRLKSVSGSVKFRINLLDVTHYSEANSHDQYIKACTFGQPFRMEAAATLNKTPSGLINSAFLENEILELGQGEIPLKSSNTQSLTSDDVGAPKKNAGKISDNGEKSREQN